MKCETMMKVMAAVMVCGSLMSPWGGMAALAVPAEPPKNVEITKILNKGVNDYAPDTAFEFTVAPGKEQAGTASTQKVYAGPAGGVTVGGKIQSKPGEGDIGSTQLTVGTTNLVLHEEKFTKPGVYRYIVSEKAGTYDGVTYSAEKKWFDVYVDNNKKIYSYTFTNPSAPEKKDDGIFENRYELKDLTVEKSVKGVQGDRSKAFDFTILINGAAGEKYYGVMSNGAKVTFDTGVSKTIQLKDTETIVIYGLSPKDTFDVRETDYATDGYKTTVDGGAGREKQGSLSADQSVKFVNTKEGAAPTGIFTERMPYVVMIAAGAGMLLVFSRRKDRPEA